MTEAQKLTMLKVMVGEDSDDNDEKLSVYITLAASKILERAYPYDNTKKKVPDEYACLQCEIAEYLWNKRGAEGQLSHSENGISRSYESASVPSSMLSGIVPYCGVLGGSA